MESFSRTELQWLRIAVISNIDTLRDMIDTNEFGAYLATKQLATLRIEGLEIVRSKLDRIINGDDKRIGVTN